MEFPVSYSQQACDINASKYFRTAGVPGDAGHETSMRQGADRMVAFWVASLLDEGMISPGEEADILYDELVYALLAQMFAPNSPQWFNTGLKLKYGIEGGQNELYYYDPDQDQVVMSEDDYSRTQASACFILSIEDKLLGPHSITEGYVSETKLFKGGSGTGTNFSSIRAEGEALSGGGHSSGLMSFLKGLDRNAGAIKSGGTTRRAAKMVCLDIDHPEIEAFITWKAREEDKVIALAKMGYDADMDGEVNAKHNRINSTNPCGEYAFLDDTSCNLASLNLMRFYDPKGHVFDIDSYVHMISMAQLALEASIHWGQFPTPAIARKTWAFRATGLGLTNLASLFMSAGLPYDSDQARAIGAALAGILTGQSYAVSAMMAGRMSPSLHFDKNRQSMMRVIRNHSRAAGVRQDAPEDIYYSLPIVNHDLLKTQGFQVLSQALTQAWTQAESLGEDHGYRNAQVSVMAPTGTISFAMDCAATSVEPFFSHVVYKKLAGGGFMKLVNPHVEEGLATLGYSDQERQEILDYIMREDEEGMTLDGKIEGAPHLTEAHLPVFDTANQCGSGQRFIAWQGHVGMVAAITPLISGAVSKTVNLPNEATVEEFADVVFSSWQQGIKGITLYRDGSKYAQPLNIRLAGVEDRAMPLEDLTYQDLLHFARKTKTELDECQEKFERGDLVHSRVKPFGIRTGTTHPAQIEDVKVYITVNRDEEGEITEIFMTTDREGTLITGLLNSLSKTISVMLQYGIKPEAISKMLRGQKFEPYGFVQRHPYIKYCTSVSDLISKVLDIEAGDFTRVQVKPPGPEGQEDQAGDNKLEQISLDDFIHEKALEASRSGERLYDGSVCPNCSGTRMVKNGTCKVCLDCGETTGCS